jgi:hypothetical protein
VFLLKSVVHWATRTAAEGHIDRKSRPVRNHNIFRAKPGSAPLVAALSVAVLRVLEASACRARVDPQRADAFRARAAECVAELARLRTGGYSGDCWGHPFDWKARYGRLPIGTPTIVATGIVTNSLFTAYLLLQLDHAFEMGKSAARFVLNNLLRTATEDGTFSGRYFPRDTQRVLNATMKGARGSVRRSTR